jgi:large subunit ribosomal protein L25
VVEETMEVVKVVAQQRRERGKGPARRLRRAGKLPAVLYGHGETESLAILEETLVNIWQSEAGENAILELTIEGEPATTHNAIVREVQINPLTRRPIHVDLYRVRMDEPITVTVPLEFINIPEDRLKAAQHILSPLLRELEVECLPRDIPETITVDLAALEIGAVLHVNAVVLPSGITLITDPEEPVVMTEMMRAEVVEEAAAAGEGGAVGEGAATKDDTVTS